MALAVEDICNAALRRAGLRMVIGSIYEGSPAARAALDFYGQTRDALLSEFDWSFARETVSLGAPIKTAPPSGYGLTPWTNAYPPPPWVYEYAYPASCINIRALRPTPIFIPELLPRVNDFAQAYDDDLQAKVVLTNLNNALAVITRQVTNPAEWQDNDFIEALINRLAVLFEKQLGGDPNAVQIAERDAAVAQQQAETLP